MLRVGRVVWSLIWVVRRATQAGGGTAENGGQRVVDRDPNTIKQEIDQAATQQRRLSIPSPSAPAPPRRRRKLG